MFILELCEGGYLVFNHRLRNNATYLSSRQADPSKNRNIFAACFGKIISAKSSFIRSNVE